jgi:hypothetical protein
MIATLCNGIHMTGARVKVRWMNNEEHEEFDGIFKRAYKACSFLVGNDLCGNFYFQCNETSNTSSWNFVNRP